MVRLSGLKSGPYPSPAEISQPFPAEPRPYAHYQASFVTFEQLPRQNLDGI